MLYRKKLSGLSPRSDGMNVFHDLMETPSVSAPFSSAPADPAKNHGVKKSTNSSVYSPSFKSLTKNEKM